jgi:hypothetical protein
MYSRFQPLVFALLAGAGVAMATARAADLDPSRNLTEAAADSLFTRWRPEYHFLAPRGWLNVCSMFSIATAVIGQTGVLLISACLRIVGPMRSDV